MPSVSVGCAADPHNCPIQWVLYYTECSKNSNRFVQEIVSKGIPFHVLGLGTHWKKIWGDRVRRFHDYLTMVDPEKIIVWSDADDVLLMPSATIQDLLDAYKDLEASGSKIFFAGEEACWPFLSTARDFPVQERNNQTSPFRYLNAGLMIGKAKYLLELLRYIYDGDCVDDQGMYQKAYLDPIVYWRESGHIKVSTSRKPIQPPNEAKNLIAIDAWNRFGLAMFGVKETDYDITNGSLSLKTTHSKPLLMHFAGKSRQKMQTILDQLSNEAT
ncbi:hypothetical protein EDD86DRAFT_193922 [Gorgonomyces haynaldii]|nr:hypothetical protein EDD86DRAFT_193922 [Gorgonomyces haynaldii]